MKNLSPDNRVFSVDIKILCRNLIILLIIILFFLLTYTYSKKDSKKEHTQNKNSYITHSGFDTNIDIMPKEIVPNGIQAKFIVTGDWYITTSNTTTYAMPFVMPHLPIHLVFIGTALENSVLENKQVEQEVSTIQAEDTLKAPLSWYTPQEEKQNPYQNQNVLENPEILKNRIFDVLSKDILEPLETIELHKKEIFQIGEIPACEFDFSLLASQGSMYVGNGFAFLDKDQYPACIFLVRKTHDENKNRIEIEEMELAFVNQSFQEVKNSLSFMID